MGKWTMGRWATIAYIRRATHIHTLYSNFQLHKCFISISTDWIWLQLSMQSTYMFGMCVFVFVYVCVGITARVLLMRIYIYYSFIPFGEELWPRQIPSLLYSILIVYTAFILLERINRNVKFVVSITQIAWRKDRSIRLGHLGVTYWL